jgi:sulfate permease, SulP family
MHRFRHLLVAYSGTDADAEMVRYAAMVASWGTIRSAHFVHVLPQPRDTTAVHDQALSALKAAVERDFVAAPTVQLSYEILRGPLTDALLAQAAEREIDLLMIGDRHGPASRRALARRLAMKAPCSVWMVPQNSSADVRRILVPIDFSEPAADTMRVAISMARLLGNAESLALHVYFNQAVVTYEGYDQVLHGEELAAYERFIAPLDCRDVRVTPLFEEGANVAHVIGRVAEREAADLIVMGTRGRSRSAAILLGSVTEDMIIDAPVPLLAVKHFGARLSVLQALLDRRFLQSPGLHTD